MNFAAYFSKRKISPIIYYGAENNKNFLKIYIFILSHFMVKNKIYLTDRGEIIKILFSIGIYYSFKCYFEFDERKAT